MLPLVTIFQGSTGDEGEDCPWMASGNGAPPTFPTVIDQSVPRRSIATLAGEICAVWSAPGRSWREFPRSCVTHIRCTAALMSGLCRRVPVLGYVICVLLSLYLRACAGKSGKRLALLYVPVGFAVRFCVVAVVMATEAQKRPPTWSDATDTSVLLKAARVNLPDGGAALSEAPENVSNLALNFTRPIAKIVYHHSPRYPTPNDSGDPCTSPKLGLSIMGFLSQPACALYLQSHPLI